LVAIQKDEEGMIGCKRAALPIIVDTTTGAIYEAVVMIGELAN